MTQPHFPVMAILILPLIIDAKCLTNMQRMRFGLQDAIMNI